MGTASAQVAATAANIGEVVSVRGRVVDIRFGARLPPIYLVLLQSVVRTMKALAAHLFISLFRACAESLASENASRLGAIEGADRNIDELLEGLHRSFRRFRHTDIDEELFDLVSGVEMLREPE
jgi:ATP synthase gamma subunit